jgi:hypothetical protein
MDKNNSNKFIELYVAYIEGLKRLSAKERDEISRVTLKYGVKTKKAKQVIKR